MKLKLLLCLFLSAQLWISVAEAAPADAKDYADQQQLPTMLKGVVTDATTGESIVGATVLEVKTSNAALPTNRGYFRYS